MRCASPEVSLADGTRTSFAGEISEFALLGSEGGLARYRLRISHWIWRLAHVRNSRVWQEVQIRHRKISDSKESCHMYLSQEIR